MRRFVCLLLLVLLFLPTGCATTSGHVARSGAPPYSDDPEGNGNPAKAWYN